MQKNNSEEFTAATEAARQARQKATDAKKAADDAGGNDASLNETAQTLAKEADQLESDAQALSQTPLQRETSRLKNQGKTELEKAAYTLKKNADRIKELGGDPAEALGLSTSEEEDEDDEDDSRPATMGDLKRAQRTSAKKTALDLASEIEDDDEREYVTTLLESGKINVPDDPQEAVRIARLAANSAKNGKIVEMIGSRPAPRRSTSGGGQPPREQAQDPEFTTDEQRMMQPPYNLTKKQIIDARAGKSGPFPTAR